ncbi:MAG: infB [Candidatus Taylorbacteria bacterium]|nr:infB [Candidatus Taylorbacteria bacterium]
MSKDQSQKNRPPVVAVMGHIDHGKSTLLDHIRKTNTTDREAGGITQRMSAYKVSRKNAEGSDVTITFLDTPGHEAFGALRSRGAKVADIAILVVAADEGAKPQTIEAYKCIKEAGLPFIIAMNKIDKPNANIDRTKQMLGDAEIFVEGWGGDIPAIGVSAITGAGVPELLDMVLLLADITDLKADMDGASDGVIIEAQNSKLKGIGATIIIKNGILKSGSFVVAGDAIAPTRIFEDFQGKPIKEGHPSDPVRITGFDKLPPVGEICVSVETKKDAEALAMQNREFMAKIEGAVTIGSENATVAIPIIIKASSTDVIEAIMHEMKKIKNERVCLKVVSTGIGFVSENDVKIATTKPDSVILGFDTKIDNGAKTLAERDKINIQTFDIIYKLTEWLEVYMKEKTPKMKEEEIHGKAKILKCFSVNKDKQVLGARVEEGMISLNDEVKIIRRDVELGRGRIRQLQQSKTEAKEVKEGLECGTMIESKIEIAPGDKIESFKIVER